MKRRKRMGLHKAPPAPSHRSIGAPTSAHGVVEIPGVQAHEPMQSAFESTPEKFVAFVNRMVEARSA